MEVALAFAISQGNKFLIPCCFCCLVSLFVSKRLCFQSWCMCLSNHGGCQRAEGDRNLNWVEGPRRFGKERMTVRTIHGTCVAMWSVLPGQITHVPRGLTTRLVGHHNKGPPCPSFPSRGPRPSFHPPSLGTEYHHHVAQRPSLITNNPAGYTHSFIQACVEPCSPSFHNHQQQYSPST